jgi:serine-aspartate repeat-containing protein C/D/E
MDIFNRWTGKKGTAKLGDRVWNDLDKDGIQDDGEPGLPNVKVELLDATGTFIATTNTDSNGVYLFQDLLAAQYQIAFTLPSTSSRGLSPSYTGSKNITDTFADEKKKQETHALLFYTRRGG